MHVMVTHDPPQAQSSEANTDLSLLFSSRSGGRTHKTHGAFQYELQPVNRTDPQGFGSGKVDQAALKTPADLTLLAPSSRQLSANGSRVILRAVSHDSI